MSTSTNRENSNHKNLGSLNFAEELEYLILSKTIEPLKWRIYLLLSNKNQWEFNCHLYVRSRMLDDLLDASMGVKSHGLDGNKLELGLGIFLQAEEHWINQNKRKRI